MRLIFIFICLIQTIQCARILCVYHAPGYSHFKQGEVIIKELAARGHDVTVLSAFPQKEPVKNIRDIPILNIWDSLKSLMESMDMEGNHVKSAVKIIGEVYYFGLQITNITMRTEAVQNLLHSNETFDLIIMEYFLNEAYFGFAHHFKVPVILTFPSSPSLWANMVMGNPAPYSYIPNPFLDYTPIMNFWQRAYNSFVSIYSNIYFHLFVVPQQNEILHKYMPDAPPVEDLMYNVSLMLLNSHPAIRPAVPLQPNMIEIGGYHVQEGGVLTDDLKKYLDGATEGVIYFAMGSNFLSKNFPVEKRKAILKVFSKLKMKVLWKWEDDDLPDKPDNVRTEKWLPQSAVLAHENVKMFITHGGRLSTIESLYFGKPVLGLPMFAEQFANIQEAAYCGYGLYLSYKELDENNFYEALIEVIENPKYAKEAKYRSEALRDQQISPLDNAIYWIEYVIRHKGVPHLRNAGLNLAWYQYLLLDVVLAGVVGIWLFAKVLCVLFRLWRKSRKGTQKLKIN